MDSVYYLASLIAVLLLLRWYIRGETSGKPDVIAKGLFGMRDTLEKPAAFKAKGD